MNHKKWKKYLTEEKIATATDTLIFKEIPKKLGLKIGMKIYIKDDEEQKEYYVFSLDRGPGMIGVCLAAEWDAKRMKPTEDAETRSISYLQVVKPEAIKEKDIIVGSKKLKEEVNNIYYDILNF
jgi:hypothetical protein